MRMWTWWEFSSVLLQSVGLVQHRKCCWQEAEEGTGYFTRQCNSRLRVRMKMLCLGVKSGWGFNVCKELQSTDGY